MFLTSTSTSSTGNIETPYKPVIRFVTPVVDESDEIQAFLVLNYLGEELLGELRRPASAGRTFLVRQDGHYIQGLTKDDAWGWLLNHQRTFAAQFPQAWAKMDHASPCRLTAQGAFASRRIPMGRVADKEPSAADVARPLALEGEENSLMAVFYLPRELVFAASNELLKRLLMLGAVVLVLAGLLTRSWAKATWSRQRQARHLAASEERLRELSSRLLRIQEDERRAISREIHDELGQQATAINLDLKLAARMTKSSEAAEHLRRAIDENEALLQTLHEFAQRVRPAVLDDLGLADALETHLGDFKQRTGLLVKPRIAIPSIGIPDEIADNAFRLVQESLNNVAKHAEANRVEVDLSLSDEEPPEMLISVRDDGRGNALSPTGRGLGLKGMRERVDLLGGQLQIESTPGNGTTINIRLPLKQLN